MMFKPWQWALLAWITLVVVAAVWGDHVAGNENIKATFGLSILLVGAMTVALCLYYSWLGVRNSTIVKKLTPFYVKAKSSKAPRSKKKEPKASIQQTKRRTLYVDVRSYVASTFSRLKPYIARMPGAVFLTFRYTALSLPHLIDYVSGGSRAMYRGTYIAGGTRRESAGSGLAGALVGFSIWSFCFLFFFLMGIWYGMKYLATGRHAT